MCIFAALPPPVSGYFRFNEISRHSQRLSAADFEIVVSCWREVMSNIYTESFSWNIYFQFFLSLRWFFFYNFKRVILLSDIILICWFYCTSSKIWNCCSWNIGKTNSSVSVNPTSRNSSIYTLNGRHVILQSLGMGGRLSPTRVFYLSNNIKHHLFSIFLSLR